MRIVNRPIRLSARISCEELAAIDELARALSKTRTAAIIGAVEYALAAVKNASCEEEPADGEEKDN